MGLTCSLSLFISLLQYFLYLPHPPNDNQHQSHHYNPDFDSKLSNMDPISSSNFYHNYLPFPLSGVVIFDDGGLYGPSYFDVLTGDYILKSVVAGFIFYKNIQMFKIIFGVLFIATVISLKISHLQPSGGFSTPSWVSGTTFPTPSFPTPTPMPTPSFPNPTFPQPPIPSPTAQPREITQEQMQAYSRLMTFVKQDYSLNKAAQEGKKLDQAQYKKLSAFLAKDPFFPLKIANDTSMILGNEWIGQLSNAAKIRYVKIVIPYFPEELNDPKKADQLVNALLKDKQVGPAVVKRYGANPTANIVKSLQDKSSKLSMGYHLAVGEK